MGFKYLGLFFLLLSLQLLPLVAVHQQKSSPDPFMTTDFNQEENISTIIYGIIIPERSSMSAKQLGDNKQNIIAVNRLGGGGSGGARVGGGAFGGRSGSSGAKSSPSTKKGAVPIAAGAAAAGLTAANHLTSNGTCLGYMAQLWPC